MQPVATIKHANPDRRDRVTLSIVKGNDYVYAAASDEVPYDTDILVRDILTAWGAETWDLVWLPSGEEAVEAHCRK